MSEAGKVPQSGSPFTTSAYHLLRRAGVEGGGRQVGKFPPLYVPDMGRFL